MILSAGQDKGEDQHLGDVFERFVDNKTKSIISCKVKVRSLDPYLRDGQQGAHSPRHHQHHPVPSPSHADGQRVEDC